MSAITAKASRKMKKYAVLTREPRCFLGSFDFSWEQRKLGDVVKEIIRNDPESEAPIMMITANNGFIEQSERYAFNNAGESLKKYILLKKGELAYNHGASKLRPYGSCFALTTAENARIPFVYHCFSAENQNAEFMSIELNGAEIENQLRKIVSSGARMDGLLNISFDEYTSVSVLLPGTEEQDRIADFFRHLDNLITLHQRKCANLCSPSQVVFSLLFATSTFSWEQRKLGDIASDMVAGGDIDKDLILAEGQYPVIANALTGDGIVGYYDKEYRVNAPAVTVTGRGDVGHAKARLVNFTPVVRLLSVKSEHDVFFLENAINTLKIVIESTGVPQLTVPQLAKYEVAFPRQLDEEEHIGAFFKQLDHLITLHQRECISFTGRADSLILTANKKRTTSSWEQRKLGEMGQTYTGLSGKTKDDFGHGQARFVTYMNVFSNPISNPEMTEPIEIDPKQNEVEVGDVFFTTSSETPEEVGMSSILLEKRGKTYLNSFCFGFRPSEKIDSYYLAYMLRSESTRAKIILLAQGISRYNISKNKVMEIAVSLPSLDEQKMIGQYFSQLDNLITLHQRKPFLMKWRTSDANRNQTNRLVL